MCSEEDKRAMEREIATLREQVEKLGGSTAKKGGAGARRKGVAICAEQLDDDDFVPPIFPKGPGTRVLIEGAMSASSMFSNLSKEQCEAVIGAMYPAQRKAGDPVIVQGEPAQNYFVVDVGKCDVFVKRDMGTEELVLTIGSGASFGEIALMYECTNNITIKAHLDVTVWTIDRRTFRNIVVHSTSRKRRQYEDILAGVELFSALTKTEKSLMADALEDVTFGDGDVIMQEGAEGDYFYICTGGNISVVDSKGAVLAKRTSGDYVGERALLTNEKRMATCLADGVVEAARMDRDTFTRILGPLGEILAFRTYDKDGKEVGGAATRAEAESGTKAAVSKQPAEFGVKAGDVDNPPMNRDMFTDGPTLGIGAFGYVKLVHHRGNGKVYALKTLAKKNIIKTDQLTHCRDEIANLRAARNPFIVNLYSTFMDDLYIYMVMEYVPGGELYSVIQRGKFENEKARFLGAEIMLGLEFCHSQQVIYRDLKPENVLLDDKGHVKITDFGLSKKVVDRTFTLCGTPDYIAPEIIQNKGHNKSADYWALGVVIYEMLTGLPPFYKENEEHTTFDRICGLTARPPKFKIRWPRWLPAPARDVVEQMLQTDVTKRLGCMKNGTGDIRNHEWFKGMDWAASEGCVANGPFAFKMKGQDDTSAFDDYTGERLPKGKPLKPEEHEMFKRAEYEFF